MRSTLREYAFGTTFLSAGSRVLTSIASPVESQSSMNSQESSEVVEGPKCLNCGELLRGRYCQACGQKGGPAPVFLHDFMHELIHEFLHFDSKIVLTMRMLLFSPGMLTREYIEGRKVRYVGPVRLYLVASVVLFGILAFVPVHRGDSMTGEEAAALAEARAQATAPQPIEGSIVRRATEQGVEKVLRDPEHFVAALGKALSKTVFLLVPIFAFLTWRMYRKNLSFYVGHLYFALHLHAFIFFLMAVSAALALAGPPFDRASSIFGLVFLVYFYLALRRAFGATWLRTLAGGSAILAVYLFFNFLGIAALTIGTLYYL
jgi:hypothetical protein